MKAIGAGFARTLGKIIWKQSPSMCPGPVSGDGKLRATTTKVVIGKTASPKCPLSGEFRRISRRRSLSKWIDVCFWYLADMAAVFSDARVRG